MRKIKAILVSSFVGKKFLRFVNISGFLLTKKRQIELALIQVIVNLRNKIPKQNQDSLSKLKATLNVVVFFENFERKKLHVYEDV